MSHLPLLWFATDQEKRAEELHAADALGRDLGGGALQLGAVEGEPKTTYPG
jgi:hypothetical protein